MIVYPEGAFYSMVKVEDVPEIVEEHLLKGRIVKRLLYQETVPKGHHHIPERDGLLQEAEGIALRNCGVINPENIDEYIARTATPPWARFSACTPSRCPGDQGFRPPRARRRRFPHRCEVEPGREQKPTRNMCSATPTKGDPGAFMDRSHSRRRSPLVLEAMAMNGYASAPRKS